MQTIIDQQEKRIQEKDADKGSEETVLKVAAFEGGNGTQIWEDIAKAFEESHDGVKVELEMSPELDKDLTKAIQNGDVPDVVYYNLGQPSGFTETMLKEEAIADISDVFDDELKDKMLDGILDGTDAQPYGDGRFIWHRFSTHRQDSGTMRHW